MILARVITGEFCLGTDDLLSAPYKPHSRYEVFDSVVDDVSQPTMYAVFHDASAYPEYVIKYKYWSCPPNPLLVLALHWMHLASHSCENLQLPPLHCFWEGGTRLRIVGDRVGWQMANRHPLGIGWQLANRHPLASTIMQSMHDSMMHQWSHTCSSSFRFILFANICVTYIIFTV